MLSCSGSPPLGMSSVRPAPASHRAHSKRFCPGNSSGLEIVLTALCRAKAEKSLWEIGVLPGSPLARPPPSNRSRDWQGTEGALLSA